MVFTPLVARLFPLIAVVFMAIQFMLLLVPPPKHQPPSTMSSLLLSNLNKLLLTFPLSWCALLGPTYKKPAYCYTMFSTNLELMFAS